jgi:hypothetical protein
MSALENLITNPLFWLILCCGILTIFLAMQLYNIGKTKKTILSILQNLQTDFFELVAFRDQSFIDLKKWVAKDDQEPFSTLLGELQNAENAYCLFKDHFINKLSRIQDNITSSLSARIPLGSGSSAAWNNNLMEIESLSCDFDSYRNEDIFQDLIQSFNYLPTQFDERISKAYIQLNKIDNDLITFEQHNLNNNDLSSAKKILKKIEAELEPLNMHNWSEFQLSTFSETTKLEIIQANNNLTDFESKIGKFARLTSTRLEQFIQIKENQTIILSTKLQIEESLEDTPHQIDTQKISETLSQAEATIANLQEFLTSPNLEEIAINFQISEQLKKNMTENFEILERAEINLEELTQKAVSLSQNSSDLLERMENSHIYGNFILDWDVSLSQIKILEKKVHELLPNGEPLSPHQIITNLQLTNESLESVIQLNQNSFQIEKKFKQVCKLVIALMDDQVISWYQNALKLISDAVKINSSELPSLEIESFHTELIHFINLRNQINTFSENNTFHESKISDLLKEIVTATDKFAVLKKQHQDIQQRYQSINQLQIEFQTRITAIEEIIAEIKKLQNNYPILRTITPQDIQLLSEKLLEYKNPSETDIENSDEVWVAQINNLYTFTFHLLENWTGKINKQVEIYCVDLALLLKNFPDLELTEAQAISTAQKILSHPPLLPQPEDLFQPEQYSFHNVAIEIQKACDKLDLITDIKNEIKSLEWKLTDARNEFDRQREEAKNQIFRMQSSTNLSKNGSFQLIKTELDKIEEEKDQFLSTSQSVKERLNSYSMLSRKYQSVVVNAMNVAERTEKEFKRISYYQIKIDEAIEAWKKQAILNQNNLIAYNAINHMLEKSEKEISLLEKQFDEKTISYHRLINRLETIQNQLQQKKIPLGKDQKMDISGTIINAEHPRY